VVRLDLGAAELAGQERIEQPAASSSAPGSRCPYWSSVMRMFAWPMNVLRAFTFTPAAIMSEAYPWRHSWKVAGSTFALVAAARPRS
jgi:hypothetical protein